MRRRLLAASLQLSGIAAVATGVGLVAAWGGVIIGGIGLILIGITAEREAS